jgi:putative SOS response-associated peptidase YedK
MCGRFTASFEFREIKLLLNVQRDLPLLAPRYNIAPSQEVPVIVQNDGINQLKPMKWGLVPSWSPDSSIGNNLINARAETRCLTITIWPGSGIWKFISPALWTVQSSSRCAIF